jgi:hypothetical protein
MKNMWNIWKYITQGNLFSQEKNFSVKRKMRAITEKTVRFHDAAEIRRSTWSFFQVLSSFQIGPF